VFLSILRQKASIGVEGAPGKGLSHEPMTARLAVNVHSTHPAQIEPYPDRIRDLGLATNVAPFVSWKDPERFEQEGAHPMPKAISTFRTVKSPDGSREVYTHAIEKNESRLLSNFQALGTCCAGLMRYPKIQQI